MGVDIAEEEYQRCADLAKSLDTSISRCLRLFVYASLDNPAKAAQWLRANFGNDEPRKPQKQDRPSNRPPVRWLA